MFKIDDSTANPSEPLRTADGPNPGGAFDDALETIVTDEFMNAVQNELSNVVTMNGGSLDKQDDTQLYSTILRLITGLKVSNWTELANPKNITLRDIMYDQGLFVAVGAPDGVDAYIVTSPGGVVWTERANPKNFNLNSITKGGNLFVAVGAIDGADAYIVTANDSDLDTWTERANPKNIALNSVTFANGLFVAVGEADGVDAYIVTSPDGITWTERANPKNIELHAITYGNGLFVAVGNIDGAAAYIVTSPDGVTWTQRTNPILRHLNAINFDGGMFAVVGTGGFTTGIGTSLDGITWANRTRAIEGGGALNAITSVGGLFVAVGDSGVVARSENGSTNNVTWPSFRTLKNFALLGIASSDEIVVAVGAQDGADAYMITSLRSPEF